MARGADEIDRLANENQQLKASAASVEHALSAAIQFTETLIVYAPNGYPMAPQVATAKHMLDVALDNMRRSPALTACMRCEQLIACLDKALHLMDLMLVEVSRNERLPMSLVVAHEAFTSEMNKLLQR